MPIGGLVTFVDTLSPLERSQRMAKVKSKGTKPEMLVRRLVHSMGYRYRLHGPGLPGRPDLVFKGRRKVIFVHGCFWHRHEGCRLARLPKSRLDFWLPKLEGNKQRDAQKLEQLCQQGWKSLVIWECELKDLSSLEKRLRAFLG